MTSTSTSSDFRRRETKTHCIKVVHYPKGRKRTYGYFDSVEHAEAFIHDEAEQATDEQWNDGESYFEVAR